MANNLMSISEMIHASFGESKNNVVNFKLVQAVLYLLARHLRVLERQVEVKEGIFDPNTTSSKLSVTEVKISGTVQKKKKKTTLEFTQKTEKSSTSTNPEISTDEKETDKILSTYKSFQQTTSSFYQSISYKDKKSSNVHIESPTSDKKAAYKPKESSDDLRSTLDAFSKLVSSKSSEGSISDEAEPLLEQFAKAEDKYARTFKNKLSLREDPMSSSFFRKIVQYPRKASSLENIKEQQLDSATVAFTQTDVATLSKKGTTAKSRSRKYPWKAQIKAEKIYDTAKSDNQFVYEEDAQDDLNSPTSWLCILPVKKRLSICDDPISSTYLAKVGLKSLEEPGNLSMHDVVQQFHSFKASLGSLHKPSMEKKKIPGKKYSLPSLKDVSIGSGEALIQMQHVASKQLYDVATVPGVMKEKNWTYENKRKEKQVKGAIDITSFKLPTIESTHSFTLSLEREYDKVESIFLKLRRDPVAMPYFTKVPSSAVTTEKTIKFKKMYDKKSRRKEHTNVTFDENYEIFPKAISFQEGSKRSRNIENEQAELSEDTSKVKKLLVTEDPISMPYFAKAKYTEVIHTTKGRKEKYHKFLVNKASKTTEKITKNKLHKTTEIISPKLPEHVESGGNLPTYAEKRPNLFVEDDEHKSSFKQDIAAKLNIPKEVSSPEVNSSTYKSSEAIIKGPNNKAGSKETTGSTLFLAGSKDTLQNKNQNTSTSSLDTPSMKPSLYEEAVAAARKLSLQEDEGRKTDITKETIRKLSLQETEQINTNITNKTNIKLSVQVDDLRNTDFTKETISQDDLFSQNSQSSATSQRKSFTSDSGVSRKYIEEAKSTENKNENYEEEADVIVITPPLSPLHSDQSFVIRHAGPYSKPLPKAGLSQPSEKVEKTFKHRLVLKHKKEVTTQKKTVTPSIDYKGQKDRSAGSSISMTSFEGEADYEVESYGEVKDDDGSSDTSSVPSKKGFFRSWFDAETLREKQLRVINQRANSHDEPDIEPIPMALVPSTETKQEKLLILERKSSMEASEKRVSLQGTPKLSIVTMEEFLKLKAEFIELRDHYAGTLEFPENAELMQQIRQGASLTDAMSALKLSARLEAAEKAVEFLSSVVTDICKGKGIDIQVVETAIKVETESKTHEQNFEKEEDVDAAMVDQEVSVLFKPRTRSPNILEDDQFVTFRELDKAMEIMQSEMVKNVRLLQKTSDDNSNRALKTSQKMEEQLGEALNLGNRMDVLYEMVSKYCARVTDIDMGISAQMTSYQDQLTQMQFDLESTMDSVAEAITSSGADPELIIELRCKLTALQQSFDSVTSDQKEVQKVLHAIGLDLEDLWKQIEQLRATKCDHEELEDKLHDKVDIAALNGMVHQEQFDACIKAINTKIVSVYGQFDAQERGWQEAIEDLEVCLNDKADFTHVSDLRNNLQSHLQDLLAKIKHLTLIVGEAPASAVSRQLLRDTDCLCCRRPVPLSQETPGIPKLPALTRPTTIGVVAVAEDGDGNGLCYPGQPIPQALDPRTKLCHRYCGGEINGERRQLMKIDIKPLGRDQSRQIGTDGKVYLVDESLLQPCLPCNYAVAKPEKLHAQEEQRTPKSEEIAPVTSPKSDNCILSQFPNEMRDNSVSNTMPFDGDDDYSL